MIDTTYLFGVVHADDGAVVDCGGLYLPLTSRGAKIGGCARKSVSEGGEMMAGLRNEMVGDAAGFYVEEAGWSVRRAQRRQRVSRVRRRSSSWSLE